MSLIDSVIVVFDDIYKITHYRRKLPTNLSPKYYAFSSNRNIYNDSNYLRELYDEKSRSRSWRFTYTFTEQDYLDAK